MRIQLRKTSKVCWGGGKNKQERLESAVGAYLEISRELDHKVEQAKVDLEKGDLGIDFIELMITLFQIEYYQGMLQKHIDLVDRRLLQGEKIPHSEKVFSIFEDHVEWIKKGKSNNRVEIGHKVLIATDQYHFILSHQLVERQEDVALAVPLAQTLADQFGQIESLSFDRGFFSQTNK